MANITTTLANGTNPLIWPSNTRIDRDPATGYLYVWYPTTTANQYAFARSTDGGSSWSATWSTFTRASVVELGSVFIDNEGHANFVYRTNESSQDRIYFQRLRLSDGVYSGETLVSAPGNGGVAGAVFTGMDLQVVIATTLGHYIAIAVGCTVGSQIGVILYGVRIPRDGVHTINNDIFGPSRQWLYTGSGRITPSIDIEHIGDGKGAASPNLWVAFGRAKTLLVKYAWAGNGWVSPSGYQTIASSVPAMDQLPARWDGQRFVMAVAQASSADKVTVYERNQANSSTTTRTTPTHPTGTVRNASLSWNSTTRDLRVYAVGTSSTVLYYVDFVRATGVWGSWATVLATAVLGTTGNNYSIRRGSSGNVKFDIVTAHSTNTITHTQQSLPAAPSTPTWASPTSGQAQDTAAGLTLDWNFVDIDPNDTQAAYALQRQIGGGSLQYYTASGGTWGGTEVFNSTGTTAVTLASGWGSGSDANHTYKVKTRDSTALDSGYSAGLVAVPSVKVNPSFTAPSSGATINASQVAITWTVSEQTAYQVKLLTNPGGVVTYDSGKVTSTSTSHTPSLVLADNSGWTIQLTTWNSEGLASTTQTRNFSVDIVPPATPTIVATPVAASGWISVAITNPAPSGGQPAVTSQDLYRRKTGDATSAKRVATGLASGATYQDWKAWATQAFEYSVVVYGANGAASSSAWTA